MARQGTVIFVNGAFYHAGHVGVWRSVDGENWRQIYFPTTAYLGRLASNGHGLMAVAPNLNGKFVLHTDDFTTWRRAAPLPGEGAAGVQVIYGELVAAFGRYYLNYTLLGSAQGLPTFTPQLAWTTDGSTWTLTSNPLTSVRNIAAGNGRMLAFIGSPPTALSSTDGAAFTSATVPNAATSGGSLLYAGGRFFFADTLHASIDGRTWGPLAPVALPSRSRLLSMAYGNGRYVAVGYAADADLIATLVAPAPPVVAVAPVGRTVTEGARATLGVTLENPDATTTFQWRRNGVPITGATAANLELAAVRSADAGTYSVEIKNALGSTTTDPVQLTVLPASAVGRIINLSVLTTIDAASGPEATFTVGFVIGGSATQGNTSLLVRAAGPALVRFGVPVPNADPLLELFSGAKKVGENDNWGGGSTLADVATRVGAFPFVAADSKDAAVFSDAVAGGEASVKISSVNGATGSVIAEVYDATPAGAYTATTPRLVNVSVIKTIRGGASLSAGFVLGGSTPRSVVIRVVGPSLSGFGVAAPLNDPRAAVYRAQGSTPLVMNDDWGGGTELTTAFAAVGAFPLPSGSRDSALLLTLEPGDYVVHASNPGTAAGTALIEIYEVPQ